MDKHDAHSDRRTALSASKQALLEQRLRGIRREAAKVQGIPCRPAQAPAVLSTGQERLWFLHQLDPESPAYTMYQAFRLRGELDPEALADSINNVVRRHDSLRMTFETADGRPVPVVAPARTVALPVEDLSSVGLPDREAEMHARATRLIRQPFDLREGPLLRCLLLRLSPTEHVFVLAMHHIIADEWSLEVFWREITAGYRARVTGTPAALPALPIQYTDYAHWQQEQLRDGRLQDQLAYWIRQLEGLAMLDLPTDHPRPIRQTFSGALRSVMLSPECTTDLQALRKQQGVTLFVLMLAAFQTLLHRYTGQSDVAVGVPVTNRSRAEVQDLIGFFINTLVLRTDFAGTLSFLDVLERVRTMVLEALAHQDVPFEKLVEELNPARRLSHNPLFQVMFVLQQEPDVTSAELPVAVAPVPLSSGAAKFDLTLFVTEAPDRLTLTLEYNTDLFEPGTIDRMLGHLQVLLAGIAAQPEQPITALPLLTDAERQHVLGDLAAPAPRLEAEVFEDLCLHTLIETQVAQTPDAVAVVFDDEHLTYAALDRRANRLAHYLRALGIGPSMRVGIYMERSLELVVGILGVLKAGGAYVPLDPSYPADRLRYLLDDAAAPVLVTQAALAASLPPTEAQVVVLDDPATGLDAYPETTPDAVATADDLAYVIYTSGSTGAPKGVKVTHRNVVSSTLARPVYYGAVPERFLLLSSVAFDSSVAGLFWPLCTGGTLVLPRQRQEQDVQALLALIRRHQVTHTLCIPSFYTLLLTHAAPADLDSLRTVIVAGEACPPDLGPRHHARLPQATLHNEYGPTEATVWSTVYEIPPAPTAQRVPIGRPVANTEVYVLDAQRQPVPVGVPGELYIGGAGVSRGYLHRDDLTAERFIPHLFDAPAGARLYRTGDRVRFLHDGTLEFLGRLDDQIKVRGHRIEPGEVEAALVRHPAVLEAAVVARADGPAQHLKLVAYGVPVDGRRPDPGHLRQYLNERLPDYMVPSAVVVLDALPRTPNGKVDAQALPAPDPTVAVTNAYVAPRTEREATLAAIWKAVLGIDSIGIHDNFFEIGGDSILSIQIIARMRQAGLQGSPNQLFEHQTIAELAAAVTPVAPPPVEPDPVTGSAPLTPIQHWFFEQNLAEPHHWHHAVWLDVPVTVTAARLEQALRHLVAHHDALRLRFEQTPSGWRQTYVDADDITVPVTTIDLTGCDEAAQAATLEAAVAEVQASMRLDEAPLVRAALVGYGPDRPQRLLLSIHHLIVDPVSWPVVLEDLQTTYRHGEQGIPVTLPARTTSFQAWAEALQTYAQSDALREEQAFWLADAYADVPRLPVDHAGGRFTEATAQTYTVHLDADETRALLLEVPDAYNTQIDDVLLTALVQALMPWTGASMLLVGLERHGREAVQDGGLDLSRTVGWFTAFFPVCLHVNPGLGPGEALKAVKEHLRQIPGRGVGYGVLRYLSGHDAIQDRLRSLPQPEVVFNYLGRADGLLAGDALFRPQPPIFASRGTSNHRSHVLEINAFVTGGRLTMHWTFSTAVHRPATIHQVARRYLEVLRGLIAHCVSPDAGGYTPSDFPDADLSQEDLDRLLENLF